MVGAAVAVLAVLDQMQFQGRQVMEVLELQTLLQVQVPIMVVAEAALD